MSDVRRKIFDIPKLTTMNFVAETTRAEEVGVVALVVVDSWTVEGSVEI